MSDDAVIGSVRWDERGLVPAIAQDTSSHEVLMMAWMNREALQCTLATGIAHYWSRSRGQLWKKGETSGHLQRVREIRLDCDGDTVLLKVDPAGGQACHTGRRRCFFRRLDTAAGEGGRTRWVVSEAEDPVLTSPGPFSE